MLRVLFFVFWGLFFYGADISAATDDEYDEQQLAEEPEEEEVDEEEESGQKSYHSDEAAHKKIEPFIEALRRRFEEFAHYELQVGEKNKKSRPLDVHVHSGMGKSVAEEVGLETAYAAFFCEKPENADVWVRFRTFRGLEKSVWSRLGFSFLNDESDIRGIVYKKTLQCRDFFQHLCLKGSCQSVMCGAPKLMIVGATCGLCYSYKGGKFEAATRKCQKDFLDEYIHKKGSHAFNKQMREAEQKAKLSVVNNPYKAFPRTSVVDPRYRYGWASSAEQENRLRGNWQNPQRFTSPNASYPQGYSSRSFAPVNQGIRNNIPYQGTPFFSWQQPYAYRY